MDKREYFQYGDLKLPVMGGLYAFGGEKGYDFAEYSLASGKNVLKPVGEKLRSISISIMLRAYLGDDIKSIIDTVDKMMESGLAYDLIFINGYYKGKYFISTIQDRVEKTLPNGDILEYDFTIDLIESEERIVLLENVQKNPKHKPEKKSKITHRVKTKKVNQKVEEKKYTNGGGGTFRGMCV